MKLSKWPEYLKVYSLFNVDLRFVSQNETKTPEIMKDTNKKLRKPTSKSLCTPVVRDEDAKKIKSVLGFNIGLTYMSWAAMRTEANEVTHLDHIKLPRDIMKMELNYLYDFTSDVIQSFPAVDCCVMESLPKLFTGTGGRVQQTLHSSRLQFAAMLVSQMYNIPKESSGAQIITYLKPRIRGRLFNLVVGSELVSSEVVVCELMEGISSSEIISVTSLPDVLTKYRNAEKVEKEIMGQAFLITLTFTELVVHKNKHCLKKIFGDAA